MIRTEVEITRYYY